MKIKTKYSVGDIVIILRDNNVVPEEIMEIRYCETFGYVSLKYRIKTLSNSYYAKEEWVGDDDIWGKYSNKKAKSLLFNCCSKVSSESKKKLEDGKK